MEVQYDEKTDAVIYTQGTDNFRASDWLRLAAAALDQAGAHFLQDRVGLRLVEEDGLEREARAGNTRQLF